jgi:hypothetical protein
MRMMPSVVVLFGLFFDSQLVSSESLSLILWGGTLIAFSSALRLLSSSRPLTERRQPPVSLSREPVLSLVGRVPRTAAQESTF